MRLIVVLLLVSATVALAQWTPNIKPPDIEQSVDPEPRSVCPPFEYTLTNETEKSIIVIASYDGPPGSVFYTLEPGNTIVFRDDCGGVRDTVCYEPVPNEIQACFDGVCVLIYSC